MNFSPESFLRQFFFLFLFLQFFYSSRIWIFIHWSSYNLLQVFARFTHTTSPSRPSRRVAGSARRYSKCLRVNFALIPPRSTRDAFALAPSRSITRGSTLTTDSGTTIYLQMLCTGEHFASWKNHKNNEGFKWYWWKKGKSFDKKNSLKSSKSSFK